MRPLTPTEIAQLETQQCTCIDWSQVQVSEQFSLETIRAVRFSGKIRLGAFKHTFTVDGVEKHAGISHATLHNCTVDDDAYIANVHNHIANYHIAKQAFIENINTLSVPAPTAFGNGTRVAVLDETGSREISIYNELSAQMAHLLVWQRQAVEVVNPLINKYVEEKTSATGFVGHDSRIVNCGTVRNVYIHENAHIEGATLLENGTVNSHASVGAGVIARDFILASDAAISDAAQIERCFVGEGTVLGKQFSATDSLFFANCQGFHGEAVAVFAAPYTVTHHKSTLLIGGMFSFFNAGSASNQSNHAYKLGAIHYGTLGRGSKMASGSYLFAPYTTGTFSLVMGVHKRHIDTTDLPFSYLIATPDGDTVVAPALALKSIGTYRDADKWQKRDLRRHRKTDRINFSMLNPHTVQQIFAGMERLQNDSEKLSSYKIKENSRERGLELYQMALDMYFGEALIRRLEQKQPLHSQGKIYDEWQDLAGLIVPKQEFTDFLQNITNQKNLTLQSIEEKFTFFDENFAAWEWNYIAAHMPQHIAERYISAKQKLLSLLIADAEKEFILQKQNVSAAGNHPFLLHLAQETETKIAAIRQFKA